MAYLMHPFDNALRDIVEFGERKRNRRTGQETISLSSLDMQFDLRMGFPFVSRRRLSFNAVKAEVCWFLEGSTSLDRLKTLGASYWEPWRDPEWCQRMGYVEDSVGDCYGSVLRNWGGAYGDGSYLKNDGFDQLAWLIDAIKADPSDRGLIISLWDHNKLSKGRLRPCAMLSQILCSDDGEMDWILFQRSSDFGCGVGYNIAFYSIILTLVAHHTGFRPRFLFHKSSDAHIYCNQLNSVDEYLSTDMIDSPNLVVDFQETILDYSPDKFRLIDYNPGRSIKFEVSV